MILFGFSHRSTLKYVYKIINEKITHLIHYECIKGSFLFNKKITEKSFNRFMIGKFELSNMPLS